MLCPTMQTTALVLEMLVVGLEKFLNVLDFG